jgi:hypothetical protein
MHNFDNLKFLIKNLRQKPAHSPGYTLVPHFISALYFIKKKENKLLVPRSTQSS